VVGLDYHTTNVSATGPTIEVGQNQDVTIKIDTVYGPLDGGSFTAREGESAITLKASVTPDSLAPRIKWTVMVDPGSFDGTPLPDNELTGAATSFAVAAPPDPVGRWPIVHPGGLPEKRLGYAVRASVEVNGRTYDSETRTLQQVERDVLREEYLELSVSVPREPNARFPEVADIGRDTTVHFNEHELNVRGDYTLYWAQAVFRDGIETVRSLAESDTRKGEAFPGLAVEASFRSPVHHEIHLVREGTVPKRYTSNHEFGLAIDFRLTGQPGLTAEQFFEKLRVYAKDRRVGACFEPRETITAGSKDTVPGHAHIDWGLPCEPDWS
jgi:hypothetical protein